MNSRASGRNPFWGLVLGSAGCFCLTILAYLASGLGSPAAPLNRFFTRYGFLLVCIEAAFIVVTGVAALTVDSRQTRHDHGSTPAGHDPIVEAEPPE
jgi:hypothetical protein